MCISNFPSYSPSLEVDLFADILFLSIFFVSSRDTLLERRHCDFADFVCLLFVRTSLQLLLCSFSKEIQPPSLHLLS